MINEIPVYQRQSRSNSNKVFSLNYSPKAKAILIYALNKEEEEEPNPKREINRRHEKCKSESPA